MSAMSSFSVLAILQARLSSSRLPGKVLKPILGKPMIQRQVDRLAVCKNISQLVVATSTDKSDDPLTDLCESIGVPCYRGPLEDVLGRYHETARYFDSEHILRLTADCPLADPEVIDDLVTLYFEGCYDYASNTIRRTYPKGIDAEIFRRIILERVNEEAMSPFDREHVTPYIYKFPDRSKLGNLRNSCDLSHHRWTVDWPEDLEFVREVYSALHMENPQFGMSDILALQTKRPEILKILTPVMNR